MAYKSDWSAQSIRNCLSQYDRFVRHDIENGLDADPLKKALPVDGACSLYATSVSDNRYILVWQLDVKAETVRVKFALPMQYRGEDPAALKEKIGRVIAVESHGLMSLKEIKPLDDAPAAPSQEASDKGSIRTGKAIKPLRPLTFSPKSAKR